jgi:amidophosphoribosyltransferase
LTVTKFDTSCFSGKYVTGEEIGDEYFSHLHELRNDKAQEERRGSATGETDSKGGDRKRPLPRQSNDGCEGMSNDKRTIGLVS